MEVINEFLSGPVRVWHLLVVAIPIFITLSNMQRQMNAQGRVLNIIWDRVDPEVHDPI
jgi:hypothetical protein